MDQAQRRDLADRLLEGYVSGPAAATQATARALARVQGASMVVFVEGVSDQIALESSFLRLSVDLVADGVVVLPIGGAHGLARTIRQTGSPEAGVRFAGLCDAAEETVFRRGLDEAHVGSPRTRADMEDLGFFVCVEDLEDEFLRAVG